ncbi:MAG: cysteine desulfurase [Candidatus Hydrogenedentes bacterium]|nr:cysteine desulfurase [Candidatus Hydrogenedentota bacterium]
MHSIYLDHSATTPVRPEVFDAMLPYLCETFGNPGSIHRFGREARRAIDDARDQVAALINADPREIILTSGGTESDNMAVRGAIAAQPNHRHLIVSSVEHHAVLHPAEYVHRHDAAELTTLGVDPVGRIHLDDLSTAITEHTALVSVMHGNNETGTIQPVDKIAELCIARGVLYHCDTVQSIGKVPIDVSRWPVSILAISGHKIGAPKGVGACYVRNGVKIEAQQVGGGQERERRAGTENVAGIVALGKACELARLELSETGKRITALRDQLEHGILENVPGAYVNGSRDYRLPHIVNIGFPGVDGESLVLAFDSAGIAVSSGAACTAGSLDPSHVLLAMGVSYEKAQSAIRFSLGRDTTVQQISYLIDLVPALVARVLTKAH